MQYDLAAALSKYEHVAWQERDEQPSPLAVCLSYGLSFDDGGKLIWFSIVPDELMRGVA